MANFVKAIRERGIVISKELIEAREAGESFDGTRKWDKRDEEYQVEVISCDEEDFSKDFGIPNGTRCKYKVDKATFEKVKFGDWANVKYEMSQYGDKTTFRPLSFALVENRK